MIYQIWVLLLKKQKVENVQDVGKFLGNPCERCDGLLKN